MTFVTRVMTGMLPARHSTTLCHDAATPCSVATTRCSNPDSRLTKVLIAHRHHVRAVVTNNGQHHVQVRAVLMC